MRLRAAINLTLTLTTGTVASSSGHRPFGNDPDIPAAVFHSPRQPVISRTRWQIKWLGRGRAGEPLANLCREIWWRRFVWFNLAAFYISLALDLTLCSARLPALSLRWANIINSVLHRDVENLAFNYDICIQCLAKTRTRKFVKY